MQPRRISFPLPRQFDNSFGDHQHDGINLSFETEILSDSALLHNLVAVKVEAGCPDPRVMRDPMRVT